MGSIPAFKKLIYNVERCRNYLFRAQLSSLILFQKSVTDRDGKRNGKKVRLMIRNCRYSRADAELVRRVFRGDRKKIKRFQSYLKKGAEGHLLYTDESWVGYLWTIQIPLREKGGETRPENYRFVGLPQDFTIDNPHAFLSFAGEINPSYRGKGAFLYLIEKTYDEIRSVLPEAIIYSNVEADNAPSIKSKLKMGELPVGHYRSMHLRIMGRHIGNVYSSKLNRKALSQLSLN